MFTFKTTVWIRVLVTKEFHAIPKVKYLKPFLSMNLKCAVFPALYIFPLLGQDELKFHYKIVPRNTWPFESVGLVWRHFTSQAASSTISSMQIVIAIQFFPAHSTFWRLFNDQIQSLFATEWNSVNGFLIKKNGRKERKSENECNTTWK